MMMFLQETMQELISLTILQIVNLKEILLIVQVLLQKAKMSMKNVTNYVMKVM